MLATFDRTRVIALPALELLLMATLGLQAARVAWLLLVPPAPLGATPAAVAQAQALVPLLTGRNPFLPADTVASGADIEGLILHAVRVPGLGEGSAILAGPDGLQASFSVGEEVAPGVFLAMVATDHVVLNAGGNRQQLQFDQVRSTTSTPNTALPTALPAERVAAPQAIDPQQLLAEAGLRPRSQDGRVTGYSVIPRGNGALLHQAGLQAGDVLLSVNGQALTPERYRALADDLADQSEIRITYQRDGETRTTTLQAKHP